MERYGTLEEISDGNLYTVEDEVSVGCNGCEGRSDCCRIVGDSILLDPYDVYELTKHLGESFQELLIGKLELGVVDGLIMSHISTDTTTGGCGFLNESGRCTVHAFRPGFCRMFPLGRYYEENKFWYILQAHECPNPKNAPQKVRDWIGIPEMEQYEQYIADWHFYIKELQRRIKEGMEDTLLKQINMYLLQKFYLLPYDANMSFYEQFNQRFQQTKQEIPL